MQDPFKRKAKLKTCSVDLLKVLITARSNACYENIRSTEYKCEISSRNVRHTQQNEVLDQD